MSGTRLAAATLTAALILAVASPALADTAHALCQKGFILKKKGKLEQALDSIDECLAKNPEHHEGWYQKGKIHFKLKQFDEAKQSFVQATRTDEKDSWSFSGLCGAQIQLEEIDDAIKSCKKAVEIDEKNWEGHANLGLIYRQIQKYDAAVIHYKKAIEIEPDEHFLYNNLGVVYRKMKKYSDAVKMFQKCVELDPDNPIYHLNLAIAFRAQERYELAVVEYIEATKLNPKLHQAYWDLGLCYQALGEDDKALEALEKYLALVEKKNPLAAEKAQEKIEAIKEMQK